MTKEERNSRASEIRDDIANITSQIQELQTLRGQAQATLRDLCPFEQGERVVLVSDREGYEPKDAFIQSISVTDSGDFRFTYNKVKKDGSRSSVELHTYGCTPTKTSNG